MNTISINKAKDIIKLFATNQPQSTLLFSGDTGIGKTRMGVEASNELGIALQIMHPALESEEEVGGIPDIGLAQILADMVKVMAKKGTMTEAEIAELIEKSANSSNYLSFKMPAFWKTIQKNERGIFLIDEPNRAPEQILQALFSLIEVGKRTLRDQKLGDGWLIVLCINPPNGFYQVRELAPAFKRRTFQFKVKFDLESWLAWGEKNGIHPAIIGMGKATPSAIWMNPNECEDEIPPTPASWTEINNCIESGVIDMKNISNITNRTIMSGKVGEFPTLTFIKYVTEKFSRPVTGAEVFGAKGWTAAIKKKFFEQQQAGKNDRMATTIEDMVRYLKDLEAKNKVTETVGARIRTVLKDEKFATVYRSSFMVSIVSDDKSFGEVAKQIAMDKELMGILTEEVNTSRAK